MGKFKVFDTIDKFMKLYEADEDPTAGGGEDATQGADATNPPAEGGDPASSAENEAPPETDVAKTSVTISLAQKIDWANIMLRALLLEPKTMSIGSLSDKSLKITPQNVDEVMQQIKVAVDSSSPTALNDKNIEGSLPNELSTMSSGLN
jgi:hypothetical protein